MIREHCGVVAVRGKDAVKIAYEALKLLQHRGQESAGIAFVKRGKIYIEKGLGLVEEALRESIVNEESEAAIGHVRYSTTGQSSIVEAQPISSNELALAFNGNITNYFELDIEAKTDTEFILHFLESRKEKSIISRLIEFSKVSDGSFSIVILTREGEIIGFRDPRGFRPLSVGKVGNSIIIASEDSVIRQLGGEEVRDVLPGEILMIKGNDMLSIRVKSSYSISTCAFEYIYFSRPDTKIDGISVYLARVRLGEILAENHPANADIVTYVPDSSRPIAIGFSRKSKLPLEEAIFKTFISKRSFIMPNQDKRLSMIEEKFGIVADVVYDKRIVLIDDSIVRGNTLRKIIARLRDAGAKEIHVRIGSPMIRYPCYMGIDFPTRHELIAYNRNEKEIANILGADSLEYLTIDELIKGIGRKDLCLACFSGNYPLSKSYDISLLESVFSRGK
ncbi:MAG: amidophosphoribosyltransferase [Sulfolobaceae archaeon]